MTQGKWQATLKREAAWLKAFRAVEERYFWGPLGTKTLKRKLRRLERRIHKRECNMIEAQS